MRPPDYVIATSILLRISREMFERMCRASDNHIDRLIFEDHYDHMRKIIERINLREAIDLTATELSWLDDILRCSLRPDDVKSFEEFPIRCVRG